MVKKLLILPDEEDRSRGVSPFWLGLRQIVLQVRDFFTTRIGDSSIFHYLLNAWSPQGVLKEAFPRLFALAQGLDATIGECLDGNWSLTFDGEVSDQRFTEFISMEQLLVHIRTRFGERDA